MHACVRHCKSADSFVDEGKKEKEEEEDEVRERERKKLHKRSREIEWKQHIKREQDEENSFPTKNCLISTGLSICDHERSSITW